MKDLKQLKTALSGENLRLLLVKNKLTRWRFSKDMNVNYHTTYQWIKGICPPSDSNAIKAALYFGIMTSPPKTMKNRYEKIIDALIKKRKDTKAPPRAGKTKEEE